MCWISWGKFYNAQEVGRVCVGGGGVGEGEGGGVILPEAAALPKATEADREVVSRGTSGGVRETAAPEQV